MKIVIISDLHANLEALTALPEAYDELWVLGDLVNYGPNPAEVVDIVREKASLVVRGNHDHAIAFVEDPRCSAAFRAMAEATRGYTHSVLTQEQKEYLGHLPLNAGRVVGGCRFSLCHAVPSDPLYAYCGSDSPRWRQEVASLPAFTLLVGHTHLPFVLDIGGHPVVNPGSLGQPKHGAPRACYAVWEDGKIGLRSYAYPVQETIRKVMAMPLAEDIRRSLSDVLLFGGIPAGAVPASSSSTCTDPDDRKEPQCLKSRE
jgi:protein phosphatase